MPKPKTGAPGTTDQKPRWEGPPENRPSGYLPAADDPSIDRDAAGENLQDPTEATFLTQSLRKTTNRRERIAFAREHIRSGRKPAEPVPRKITGTKPNERWTPWTSPHRQHKQLQAQGRPWLSTPRTHHSPIRPESKAVYEIGYSRRSFCAAFSYRSCPRFLRREKLASTLIFARDDLWIGT
jgi:hypothetical protein